MRFLAEENVQHAVVHTLRDSGHDVACVGEVAPGASDDEVLRLANDESRLLLTNDKDFGELVYREGRVATGIFLMRFSAQDGVERARLLAEIMPELGERLNGLFATVSEGLARLRPLRRR